MDGYAVCAQDAGRDIHIVDEVAAGSSGSTQIRSGIGVAIMTGAPVPPGTEAVVRLEDVLLDGDHIHLPEGVKPGQHLQAAGELCPVGDTTLPAGSRLTPLALATAVACEYAQLKVRSAPKLTVITTGEEIAPAGQPLAAAQIHDTNGPMLLGMAQSAGVSSPTLRHAPDDPTKLAEVIEAAQDADMLILSGGVSVSRFDMVPSVLKQLGAHIVFHRVRQKPGKPILFATRGRQLVFGLPGTPLGSHLGFHRYVTASIRKWLGAQPEPTRLGGSLTSPLHARSDRTLFRLVRAQWSAEGYRIDPLRWRGSSDLVGPTRANGYCRFAPGEHELPAGAELAWEPLESV